MKTQKWIVTVLLAVLIPAMGPPLSAQEDTEDCRDHPMFSRMKNFYIYACESNFDAEDYYIAEDETTSIEGQKTTLDYSLKDGSPKPSVLQIKRNYQNAFKSLGGAQTFEDDDYFCGKLVKNNQEVWVSLQVYNDGNDYRLVIVETGEMVQEVTADDILTALEKDGFIALDIRFDTGKAEIKPESLPVIEEIVRLLTENPGLNVGIEGHTDNVGSPESNKALSRDRAQSVVAELVSRGVAAPRMSAVGWGQERPVADNRSEEGRAKNRRVEIVKK